MNLLSWNCRGLGNPRSVRILRDLVKSQKPDFLFLSETLVENNVIEDLSVKFGFLAYYSVNRVGRGGGLAIMWKRNMNVSVGDSSQNHINVQVVEENSFVWRLTCFYGFQRETGVKIFKTSFSIRLLNLSYPGVYLGILMTSCMLLINKENIPIPNGFSMVSEMQLRSVIWWR